VFFISLNNLQAWLGDNGYYFNSFFYQKFLVPWYMLILPMFYAFLVHYLKIQTKLNSFVGISLGVFFLEVILRFGLIQYVLNSNYNADDLIARYTAVEEVLNAIFGLFIFIKSSYLVFKQTDLFDFILGYDDIRWLRIFLRLGAIVFLFWVFAIVLFNITGSEEAYQPLRLSTSILLYWIGYQGFYRYHIVEDRIFLRTQITSTRSLKVAQKTSGEVKNSASEKYADEFQKIDGYVLSNQRFLDPKISMELLSEELNISTSHFSKVVNSVSKQNFSDYINSYRVEQSKKLLADPAFENYTIVAIGLECGFNSKSTFYTAFKKFTSQTPTEFRSQNL
jgi:AraC-like DNA-binding protein